MQAENKDDTDKAADDKAEADKPAASAEGGMESDVAEGLGAPNDE